jgi:ABC-type multidrug transport system fused ATPase/permease subunit
MKIENITVINFILMASEGNRKKLFLLILLMLASSSLEVVSVASVLPFIALLTGDLENNKSGLLSMINGYVNLTNTSKNTIIYGFFIIATFSGIVKIYTNILAIKIANILVKTLTVKLYQNIINSNYDKILKNSTTKFQAALNNQIDASVTTVIVPILGIINALFMLVLMIFTLILIEPNLTMFILITFLIIYMIITWITRKKLISNGKTLSLLIPKKIQIVNESIFGIKDIIINNLYKKSIDKFSEIEHYLRKAHASNHQIAVLPRTIIETISVLVLGLIVIYFWIFDSINNAFPTMALLVLGLQKIIPQLNQIFAGASSIKGFVPQIKDLLQMFENFKPKEKNYLDNKIIVFNENILLKNISLKNKVSYLFSDINLQINKGDWIGIIGPSGVGKTSLLDLIINLKNPTEGHIFVDGVRIEHKNSRSWQKNISYVSQNIFIIDGSIAENIALGIDHKDIDQNKLNYVLKLSGLAEFIAQNEAGVLFKVDENGSNLSGGQRQRIAIARALYKDSSLIILDEATSALDNSTADKIMNEISKIAKKTTILMVSHDIALVQKYSTRIWHLENKCIKE